ncbi:hypothetical protein AAHA92_25022 [Salvia divinorum]|uniref:Secreted protein n=1 Tax=Salvia divinorum TaxID=28513 RepID=A0ABD1GAD9_SALDI
MWSLGVVCIEFWTLSLLHMPRRCSKFRCLPSGLLSSGRRCCRESSRCCVFAVRHCSPPSLPRRVAVKPLSPALVLDASAVTGSVSPRQPLLFLPLSVPFALVTFHSVGFEQQFEAD